MSNRFVSLMFMLSLMSVAQAEDEMVVLHECDFNDGIPASYTIYDGDGQTHHYTMVQAGIDTGVAWIDLREHGNKGNRYAASTSKYKGADVMPANDWLITPRMRILSEKASISWRAQSVCENVMKGDTYEVRVSTTGNRPEDFVDPPLAIVEEEVVNEWESREVDLGAYVGKDVYIAFVNRSHMCEILAIDDVCVQSGHGLYEVVDHLGTHVYGSEDHRIMGLLRSNSSEKVTEFTACCRVKGQEYKKAYSGVDVTMGNDFLIEFDEIHHVAYGDTLAYQMWVEIPGERSDTTNCSFVSMMFDPVRRTIIEEGTGMWCGYCPMGIIAMERMKKKYPDEFIGVAAHYDDALEVNGYAFELGFSSYPSGWVNRVFETVPMVLGQVDGRTDYTMMEGGFESHFLAQQAIETIADVEVFADISAPSSEQNTSAKVINVSAAARFAVPRSDSDFRYSFIVVEDKVQGATFYQTNYFSGVTEYTLDGFAELGDKIYPFSFDDVARVVVGGLEGIEGSIPADVEVGEPYQLSQSIELPESVNLDNVRLVVLLLDARTGHVVNANQCSLGVTGIDNVNVAPSKSGKMFDISGRQLYTSPKRGVYIKEGKKYLVR